MPFNFLFLLDMAIEIERKFLVTSEAFKKEAFNSYAIKQGFLNSHKERTVRVRLKEDSGYLTIKGKSTANGLVRFEWEKEISKNDAEHLLKLCEEGIIDKIRYEVKYGNHIFEVDEFFGANEGLIIAEIELNSEIESFEKPKWLGNEVTGSVKYYNSQLSLYPFKDWE
ncbi:CYTH domain-containing protein [Winogradskyella forsetii]|uniref:CYTH domain-containing protein n=1 Tax=Winogradskyella forsetii TaxID=2686077 RepID=UPI001E652E01|nr:CYTH domain-containing protein [Winogradskyella forsetii]